MADMNLHSANTEIVIGIIPEFRPMMVAKEYESDDGSKPLNPSKSIYNISQVRISGCETIYVSLVFCLARAGAKPWSFSAILALSTGCT